jgi:D-alanyl-D-alanine carboxypeptidase
MRFALPWRLLNAPLLEAIPARLTRPRGNATARSLARAGWLIRQKRNGRFVAAARRDGTGWRIEPLALLSAPTTTALNDLIGRLDLRNSAATLPFGDLPSVLRHLGIPDSYGSEHALELVAEPCELAFAGFDRFRRALWLTGPASAWWRRMQRAALAEGVILDAISGYRSHAYQWGIFQRKIDRGQSVQQILAVNAAPGYSEHHSGRALDIGTPGQPPAEESFENTPAFAWLMTNAARFGFRLSYPRDNPHGIVYEPWHWCWRR